MVRIRHCLPAVALGAVLGLALIAACKKDDKGGTATGDQAAEKSGGASDDLSLLPVDSEIVLGINSSQIRQSALFKQFIEPRMQQGKTQDRLAQLKAKCGGYDPVMSAGSVSFGAKIVDDKPDGVIVMHGLDKSKLTSCLDGVKDEMAKDGLEFAREGEVYLFKSARAATPAAGMFVNDSTGVLAFGDSANAARVKAVAAGGSTLKSSAAFVEMYKKVKTSDSVWFVINGKLLEKVPLVKPQSALGSINVTDGLALDVRLRLDKPDAATEAAAMLNNQAKQAASFVDKAEITSEGSELHIVVTMSSQKLQELAQSPLIPLMMGMLMGQGG